MAIGTSSNSILSVMPRINGISKKMKYERNQERHSGNDYDIPEEIIR